MDEDLKGLAWCTNTEAACAWLLAHMQHFCISTPPGTGTTLSPHQQLDPHTHLPYRGTRISAMTSVLCHSQDQRLSSTPQPGSWSSQRYRGLAAAHVHRSELHRVQAPSPGAEAKQLAAVPQLARLGAPFRSTPPALLTEEETEYHVTLTKHIFPAHLVLQFNCTNTVPEQMLEGVTVAVDLSEAVRPWPLYCCGVAADWETCCSLRRRLWSCKMRGREPGQRTPPAHPRMSMIASGGTQPRWIHTCIC